LPLPNAKTSAPVRTFESAESHNSFEQVVYIAKQTRILTFVLSAKTKKAYAGVATVFHEFAQSCNGSIVTSPDPTIPSWVPRSFATSELRSLFSKIVEGLLTVPLTMRD
jgi:hypothetical protein